MEHYFQLGKNVGYIAAKPGPVLKSIASKLKKHLVWIPMNSFSGETLNRLKISYS